MEIKTFTLLCCAVIVMLNGVQCHFYKQPNNLILYFGNTLLKTCGSHRMKMFYRIPTDECCTASERDTWAKIVFDKRALFLKYEGAEPDLVEDDEDYEYEDPYTATDETRQDRAAVILAAAELDDTLVSECMNMQTAIHNLDNEDVLVVEAAVLLLRSITQEFIHNCNDIVIALHSQKGQ